MTTPTQGMDQASPTRPPSPVPAWRARYVPAILDAIVPGLGHLVAGRRRLAAIFGIPFLVVVLIGLVVFATTSTGRLAAEAVNSFSLILGLQGLVLVWRLLAAGASLFAPGLPRLRAIDGIPIALLALFIVGPQGVLGYVTNEARIATDQIFVGDLQSPGAYIPNGTLPPKDPTDFEYASPSPSASGSAEPSASATPIASKRVNILLIGIDSGVGRNTALTDTMIVASLDPLTNTVSMVSIPRDMVDVPLPDGRKFRPKINSLDSWARHHPGQFPGSNGTGHDVLMAALGTLLGLKIDYYTAVDLQGFADVVDQLGGVDVNVAHSFCDPTYDQYGYLNGFSITAGRHHLNGLQALAYARVRKAAGESDFTRAARQQELLNGLRDRIVSGGFLSNPVGLFRSLGRTISTNVPRSILPDLADDMTHIGRNQTYRAVIGHPLVAPGYDVRGSIQIPNLKLIHALAAQVFPTDGTKPLTKFAAPPATKGGVSGSGVSNCSTGKPKPTPKPTVKPTPKSTAKPTGKPSPSSSEAPASSEASPEPS
ncbi:MAG TPA: LCP family protein [Candidatus Binatia bacterium]|nr:LCP family protein [Candidatus Binatia bacterium]